jgi:tRNA/tmRNA/rRNA uracil-C5-methylase (TrmA/RlmC/RlmD family)
MARSRRQPETATITTVTHDGRGIADTSGKKVFVAGALSGEKVTFVGTTGSRAASLDHWPSTVYPLPIWPRE